MKQILLLACIIFFKYAVCQEPTWQSAKADTVNNYSITLGPQGHIFYLRILKVNNKIVDLNPIEDFESYIPGYYETGVSSSYDRVYKFSVLKSFFSADNLIELVSRHDAKIEGDKINFTISTWENYGRLRIYDLPKCLNFTFQKYYINTGQKIEPIYKNYLLKEAWLEHSNDPYPKIQPWILERLTVKNNIRDTSLVVKGKEPITINEDSVNGVPINLFFIEVNKKIIDIQVISDYQKRKFKEARAEKAYYYRHTKIPKNLFTTDQLLDLATNYKLINDGLWEKGGIIKDDFVNLSITLQNDYIKQWAVTYYIHY